MNETNKQLRSYSVRLEYSGNILNQVLGKSYYNYNGFSFELDEPICKLLEDSVFEFVEDETGTLVSYNFHVLKMSQSNYTVYKSLVSLYSSLFSNLLSLLGDAFINFTCSVKFDNQSKIYYEFYFYPVYRNEFGKIKTTGITDKKEQIVLFDKFNQFLFHLNGKCQDEYTSFCDLCVEFRGVSICVKGSAIEYSIFIKCSNKQLYSFLKDKMLCDIKPNSILFGIKISDGKIIGYTVYYKGAYGIPCCGWGEVII